MSLVKLFVRGITYSHAEKGAYVLLLDEAGGDRSLPIIIGTFEAQSISIALQKISKPIRPLTHDLFKSFAESFDIVIKQVIIHKLVEGLFYSSLICERDKIEEIIDSRTSDAVALALRFNAPIFTYKNILESAGILLRIDLPTQHEDFSDWRQDNFGQNMTYEKETYSQNTLEELHLFLKVAVKNEDYEKAVRIRDEISKRKT